MLELNRMAFSDGLPRNNDGNRCMAVAFRLIKKHYPHIEWILSFSDGTQCGDGTIYRASGFVLTQIKEYTSMAKPAGERFSRTSLTDGRSKKVQSEAKSMLDGFFGGGASMKPYADAGWKPIEGYQLRYIYFLNESTKARHQCQLFLFQD